jgi:hypothetical protein
MNNLKQYFSNNKGIFIFVVFITIFLGSKKSYSNNCLSFLPYGYNDDYVHLPPDASFCVKEGNKKVQYLTDFLGGRIIAKKKATNTIQVFGDSQALGLEVNKIQNHFLNKIYNKSNLKIYAAPNNGPYEVINFLEENKKFLDKKIVIVFNFSVDIFRLNLDWNPKNFVALKSHELDDILDYPIKYDWIILKNLLFNKNFTLIRYDNDKMQNLFLNSNEKKLIKQIKNYLNLLSQIKKKNNYRITFLIIKPYWVYSKKLNKNIFLLEEKILKKIDKLICSSFNLNDFEELKISKIEYNEIDNNFLTDDKRHFVSDQISFEKAVEMCGKI